MTPSFGFMKAITILNAKQYIDIMQTATDYRFNVYEFRFFS